MLEKKKKPTAHKCTPRNNQRSLQVWLLVLGKAMHWEGYQLTAGMIEFSF